MIQVQADNQEIKRRINAFIQHQRREINETNIREFCPNVDVLNGCARTNAVFETKLNTKSHVRIGRVLNRYGPQTQTADQMQEGAPPPWSTIKRKPIVGMVERLHSIESHLHIQPENSLDVYGRLKHLEERILFLESLSPEYFENNIIASKKMRHNEYNDKDKGTEKFNNDIDKKIENLRQELLEKSMTISKQISTFPFDAEVKEEKSAEEEIT